MVSPVSPTVLYNTGHLNTRMAQHLQCDAVTLATMTIDTPALVPGAVVVCTATVVVELPPIEYTIVQHWPNEQPLRLSNFYFSVPDLRGPPQSSLNRVSCRGARSCAPQVVSSIPRGGYAH